MRRLLIAIGVAGGLVIAGCLLWLATPDKLAYQPQGAATACAAQPPFIKRVSGFAQPAFDTGRREIPGLTLIDLSNPAAKPLQLPSWQAFGDLGPLARDENGVTYTANVPSINTLHTNAANHLAVLRVDPDSGQLTNWLTLKGPPATPQNYYGILGITYDCTDHLLYVSSVAGSGPQQEKGFIAVIDVQARKEIFRYPNIDAIGLAVFGSQHGRYLYAGLARNSSVIKIGLTAAGKPFGKPQAVLQFDPLNQTRARALSFTNTDLSIKTTEFNFNLLASTELHTQQLQYHYNAQRDSFEPQP